MSTLTPTEARALWSAALRSGNYKQGYGRLRRGDAYCCLGVACELYREQTGQGVWSRANHFDHCDVVMPDHVTNWLGLRTFSGRWDNEPGNALYNLNDQGETFEAIADVIDDAPEGLLSEPELA